MIAAPLKALATGALLATLWLVPALASPALAQFGGGSAADAPWPPRHLFELEHPRHRLAYWYANESMRQAQQAREMICGFTGQHWTLDWEVHYRWALRASERRVYRRVDERDRHLGTCRSRKLREYQREPYRRGSYGRDP